MESGLSVIANVGFIVIIVNIRNDKLLIEDEWMQVDDQRELLYRFG